VNEAGIQLENKKAGTTAPTLALRLFILTASDMWHPYGNQTRDWSALDCDCAGNASLDIERDDRRWNGCALYRSCRRGTSIATREIRAGGVFDPMQTDASSAEVG
jgi:hypothetical protein